MSSSSSTSRRLLALLSLLQGRRDWPGPVLAQRLEISERTLRRDVDRLRELDYAITATRGPDGGYRLGAGSHLPPLMFDDEQAVAIAIALRTSTASGAGIDEAAARAIHTIGQLMPSHLTHRIEALVVSAAPPRRGTEVVVDPGVLLRIGEAIAKRVELRFDYASPTDDTPSTRRTQPHHLVLHTGRWYLIGYSEERDDWRTYRVDRITPKSHNGRGFDPRELPGTDSAAFLSARFAGSDGTGTWLCWGHAILDAPIAAIAPYFEDGSVEALADGRSRLRLGSWSWAGLAASFARFDAGLSAVEPAELREAFLHLSERARLASA